MAIIKKYKQNPDSFPWLDERVCTIQHIFNITDETLEYQLIRKKVGEETEDKVMFDITLSLDTLKSVGLYDQSYWTLNVGPNTNDIQEADVWNIFAKSLAEKRKVLVDASEPVFSTPFRFFAPSANSKFTDMVFMAVEPGINISGIDPSTLDIVPWDITTEITVNPPNTVDDQIGTVRNELATISSSTTVSAPAAGDVINVTVTCSEPSVTTLYLEPIVGTVDRTEVALTAGAGEFNIATDTLASGDTVKVKIGFKKYSNVNTFTKTLA